MAAKPSAPAAYFSTLPIKAIVCNHIFYGLMHRIATSPPAGVRGGFIHIPYLPAQAARFPGAPSMSLETLVQALRITVKTALAVKLDIAETGGQLH